MPEDLLRAENVYNQLNFMYQRATEYKPNLSKAIQEEMTDTNNQLKAQLENSQREIGYYKN